MIGCGTLPKTTPATTKEQYTSVLDNTKSSTETIKSDAKDIKATVIDNEIIPPDIKERVAIKTDNIIKVSDTLYSILSKAIDNIKVQNTQVAKERDEFEKLYKQEKDKNINGIHKLLWGVIGISSLTSIVFLIIGFRSKSKLAFTISIGSFAVLGLAIFLNAYLETILIVLGVGAVLMVGYILYRSWKADDDDSAVTELTQFIEKIKDRLKALGSIGESVIQEFFGEGIYKDGIAHKMSSKTRTKVNTIRKTGKIKLSK